MSDKPESPGSEAASQPGKKKSLSFDEIMQSVEEQRSAPPPPPAPSPVPPKRKSAQPTFEEILEKSQPAESSKPPPAQEQRRSRPPRGREERKMPIVVRKPVLGEKPPSEPPAAAEQPSQPEREAPKAPLESVYAQPSAEESADFGAMLEESQKHKQGRFKPGQKLSARIAHLGAEVAFLDLGGKGEGIIDLRELRNEKGDLLVHVGETLEGYVLSLSEGNVVLTRSVPKGAGREVVQAALDAKIPLEGLVTGQNKGGLEVDLGGLRGFVPSSQVDVRFVEDLSQYVGQKLKFRVTEVRGGNAILSRRALLEEERAGKAAELKEKLQVGAQLEGAITSVRDFGAFVDLGGLEGMIHVSELSHAHVAHAQDLVKPGQKVRVQVLRLDKDEKGHDRIALSLKALEQDPWDAARPQLKEGARLEGKVARLQPFGAFVELFPGVDGLVHVSALADRHIQHPREVVKEGETILVQVESIDDVQKRVALRRIDPNAPEASEKPAAAGAPSSEKKRARVGDVVEATVDKCEPFGVFVHWDGGKGLVPNPELGTPRGSDNKKTNPPGTVFKASILEIDERGRYRLSKVGAERAAEGSDYREYQKQMNKKYAGGKGFGTLGDLLKARLEEDEE